MGDERCCRDDCCERECVRECQERCCRDDCCCDDNNGGLSIIWILVILYLLFCAGGNGRGGLFSGLF